MDKTTLGDRMKVYEQSCEQTLMRRVPVIVRVDGKGFSRWTKKQGCRRPFDLLFVDTMQYAMEQTAQGIEGCVFGYTQSDEMTFVLRNDQSLVSEPWFGNRLQKVCSVIASMVTAHFNQKADINFTDNFNNGKIVSVAYFDARVFTVPDLDEAANALVWRQNDATKNSISTACYYEVGKIIGKGTARKKMHGLNGKQQQELLFQETGINWNDYPAFLKRGMACYRQPESIETLEGDVSRMKWVLNKKIPIFTQDRKWLMDVLNGCVDG